MYFIKWMEQGKEKSFLAEGYWEMYGVLEKLDKSNTKYTVTNM